MGAIRSKLTFANIAAALAVVIASSSGAYAVGLAKNSVKSSHIKNGQVKSVDVKDGNLAGQDVKADSITGQDVKESTLAQVPNAGSLGGVPAIRFPRTSLDPAQGFLDGAPMEVVVPGYGTWRFSCDENDQVTLNDDLVNLQHTDSLGIPGSTEMVYARSDATGPAAVFVRTRDFDSVVFQQDDRWWFEQVVLADDGSKAIRVTGSAWDDTATPGCRGRLEADVLK